MQRSNDKFNVRDYFTFTRGERVGIISLIMIIVILAAVIYFLPYFLLEKPTIDVSRFEKEIAGFERASDSLEKRQKNIHAYKDTLSHTKDSIFKTKKDSRIVIEINTADSVLLNKLPGIGPVFAARIVKYRAKLGGFYSLQQLTEVYGMKPEIVRQLTHQLRIDTSKIQQININTSSFKRINGHPYISFEQTRYIMRLRESGSISSFGSLEEEKIFTLSEIKKLRPYIRFE